jgi:hypothetical protein
MSAESKKRRRVRREAKRRIDAELPHRAAYLARVGGLEALNGMIIPDPERVAKHYLAKGRWRF